ncbi:hypothetical protein [Rhodococcus sp. 14-2483-1-1]|uniref:hypothetical protein n=1 Tax=Rhodococcus sp. 14-2483-1-1 TaxID=2023148 RepID=UPI0011405470|nr:hypothetical protein [Rhodococcus sp. 14-2483-1-1]
MEDVDGLEDREAPDLTGHLNSAREAIGSPSLRAIAAATDYSHTTVAKAFTIQSAGLSWAVIEQVCASVNADRTVAQQLWCAANPGAEAAPPDAVDASDADSSAQGEDRAASRPELPSTVPDTSGTTGSSIPLVLRMRLVVWAGLLFCGGVGLVVVQAVNGDGGRMSMLTELVQPVFVAVAAALFGRRALEFTRAGDRLNVVFFSLLTAGSLAWMLGSVSWLVERYPMHRSIPTGPLFDLFFVASYLCAGAALWIRAERYGLARWRRRWHNAVTGVVLVAGPYALSILLLSILHLRSDAMVLLYALHPAADIALAIAALSPMIHGHRILGSAVLATAFAAAALSDIGALVLRADPGTTTVPSAAALGYVAFAIILSVYAVIARPLPSTVVDRVPVRREWLDPRDTVAVVTAVAAVVALVAAALVLSRTSATDIEVVMIALTAVTASAIATLTAIHSH